jgi:hypothetical protein
MSLNWHTLVVFEVLNGGDHEECYNQRSGAVLKFPGVSEEYIASIFKVRE